MLAKVEESYLTILRVAVVAVAGLALAMSATALVAGVIYFSKNLLSSASPSANVGGLAEFVAEQRLAAEAVGGSREPAGPPSEPLAERALSTAIDSAAGIFSTYLNRSRRGSADKAAYVSVLNQLWLQVDADWRSAYEDSLSQVADQLQNSRGRPLSAARVSDLIDWHHAHFQQSVAAHRTAVANDRVEAWLWLTRAAQAFLMFIVIAFYFLLVRVERHMKAIAAGSETTQCTIPSDPET